jgi:hypothetical protein
MTERKPAGRSEDVIGAFDILEQEPDRKDSALMPSHEEIARLAYILWQTRGGGDGEAEQDWFEAERQLRVREEKAYAA